MKIASAILTILILIGGTQKCFAAEQHTPPSPQAPDSYIPYMKMLIEQALNGSGLPFKAMIIDNKTGSILCRGNNNSRANPLLHAEIDAINNCVTQYGKKMPWHQTTLITTAEPCPMCAGAILWSHIPIIVYGSSIPTLINKGWSQIDMGVYEIAKRSQLGKPQIIGGVLENQTDALFKQRNKKHGTDERTTTSK